METKFTKGNWKIEQTTIENTDIVCQTVLKTDLKYNSIKTPVICDLYGQDTEEGKANAQLLLSAPELYECLKELVETVISEVPPKYIDEVYSEILSKSKTAINKALGIGS